MYDVIETKSKGKGGNSFRGREMYDDETLLEMIQRQYEELVDWAVCFKPEDCLKPMLFRHSIEREDYKKRTKKEKI
jgi:translation initiation factor IF-3